MNIIQIAGNIGKEVETKFLESGQKLSTFTVAAKAKKGKEDVTIWYQVTVWGERFDKVLSFLKKGSSVMIWGDLQPPEVWTDRSGIAQVSLKVTAEMIRLSPFGRKEEKKEEEISF